jgi:hypothetical protein
MKEMFEERYKSEYLSHTWEDFMKMKRIPNWAYMEDIGLSESRVKSPPPPPPPHCIIANTELQRQGALVVDNLCDTNGRCRIFCDSCLRVELGVSYWLGKNDVAYSHSLLYNCTCPSCIYFAISGNRRQDMAELDCKAVGPATVGFVHAYESCDTSGDFLCFEMHARQCISNSRLGRISTSLHVENEKYIVISNKQTPSVTSSRILTHLVKIAHEISL